MSNSDIIDEACFKHPSQIHFLTRTAVFSFTHFLTGPPGTSCFILSVLLRANPPRCVSHMKVNAMTTAVTIHPGHFQSRGALAYAASAPTL